MNVACKMYLKWIFMTNNDFHKVSFVFVQIRITTLFDYFAKFFLCILSTKGCDISQTGEALKLSEFQCGSRNIDLDLLFPPPKALG